jgi:hypothetical protein
MKERNSKMQVASADKHYEVLLGLIQKCEIVGPTVVPRVSPSNPAALQDLICLPDAGDDAVENRHKNRCLPRGHAGLRATPLH